MLEVLVVGAVGLTYTCVQTLFFLNCLNSRRRERRRLERVFRDSLRTVKGAGGKEARRSHERKEEEVSLEARNENGTATQQVIRGDTNTTSGQSEGRLVTRLVVKSGKEAVQGSHEGASTDPHCVRVQNAIVQVGGQCVEAEHESAPAVPDLTPQQPASVSLDGRGSTPPVLSGVTCTITVNTNMIEVPGDVQPLLSQAFESLEGDPMSILTQLTTLGEEGDDGRHTPPPDFTSITEEDVDAPLRNLSMGGGRGHVDLLTTISQILQSPPESMEPESESLHRYEVPPEVPSLNTTPEHTLSSTNGCEEADWVMNKGCNDSLFVSTPSGSGSVPRDMTLHRRPAFPLLPPGPQDTWTLPRACRSVTEGRASLPRHGEKLFVAQEEGQLSLSLTPPRPASAHTTGRDEAFRAGGAARGTFAFQSAPAPPSAATSPPPSTPRAAGSDWIASKRDTVRDGENSDLVDSAPPPTDHRDAWVDGEAETEDSEQAVGDHREPSGEERVPEAAVYESTEGDLPSPVMATPLRKLLGGSETGQGSDFYEEIKDDLSPHAAEDRESVGSEAQYENISESDTHADSGYESPVKADIHSSDDTASTSSASSSHDHHYEDITPSLLAEGRGRETSRRPRHKRDATDEDEEAVRQRQRLQGLDDLIAGVPPPDYDRGAPLSDESARPDVCNSGSKGDIPPPAEFDDGSDGGGGFEATSRRRLHSTLSMPPTPSHANERTPLTRTNSEPPPPPPMPATTPSPKHSPSSCHRSAEEADVPSPASSKPSSPRSAHSSVEEREDEDNGEEGGIGPSEFMRRNSQTSENGSVGGLSAERPTSLPLDMAEHYGKVMVDGREKETSVSHEDLGQSPQLGKAHMMHGKNLSFIPPKFPTQPSDSGLIKPSEYLRSLGENGSTIRSPGGEAKAVHGSHHNGTLHHNSITHHSGTAHHNGTTHHSSSTHQSDIAHHSNATHHTGTPEETPSSVDIPDSNSGAASTIPASLPAIPESREEEPVPKESSSSAPPPPPAPPAPPVSFSTNTMSSTRTNTLSTNHSNSNTLTHSSSKTVLPSISVTDLQSVQLRKTEIKSVRPTSIAIKIPLATEPLINSVKNEVIAELKMGVDIPGIKKLKSERAKEEENHIKMEKEELSRQFSASKFVDQVPDTDPSGNRIPDWKRQMLARKAAERAKKEAEELRLHEAEEKRMQSIPPWKRELMTRRDEDGRRSSVYVPKVEEVKRIKVTPIAHQDSPRTSERSQEKEEAVRGSTNATAFSSTSTSSSSSHHQTSPSGSSSKSTLDTRQEQRHEEEPPNPWRTNLRKTNSKLSLLE